MKHNNCKTRAGSRARSRLASVLTVLALLITAATGAWGKQIYISYPAWPSGTSVNGGGNLVLEVELSDSFENLKSKIEDKTGFDPTYMHLFNNSIECEDNETLAQKGVSEGSVLTLVYDLKSVKLADGTKDADKWTAKVGQGAAQALPVYTNEGDAVTLKYGGRLKVKDVAAKIVMIDLSKLAADYTAKNGDVLTGTLNGQTQPYKITIANGATVTLAGVTINGVNDGNCKWAGLTCEGSATIILKHGSTNTVKGFFEDYPGIFVPKGSTLIIKGEAAGTGALTASPFDGGGTDDSYGAGIGGGYVSDCGNIEIQGGNITATGGYYAAGIGGGKEGACGSITISGGNIMATGGDLAAGIGSGFNGSSCGTITISGGTITATGGQEAAGIGSGSSTGTPGDPISSCGTISITTGVTKVTAKKGTYANNSIGASENSTCGKVTIGCTLDGGNPVGGKVYWDGSDYQNDGDTYLQQATITYQPSN